MTPRQKQTLELVRRHGPISRSEVAKALGCAPNTAACHLRVLADAGLICAGMGHTSRWSIKTQPKRRSTPARVASVFDLGGLVHAES